MSHGFITDTNICSIVSHDLENTVDKVAADERALDVERLSRLAERVEFLRLRAIGQYDRSGVIGRPTGT